MDSLLASYASSDEEDDQPAAAAPTATKSNPPSQQQPPSNPSSLFSSLPKPQSSSSSSSSLFSSLPPPKPSQQTKQQDSKPISKTPSLFSSMPPPTSQTPSSDTIPIPPPKRVIQFRPPPPKFDSKLADNDDEDEEEDEGERERKRNKQLAGQDTSVKSFLSSMPTPKNSSSSTLGALPTSGSGRRSVIETEGTEGPSPSSSEAGLESNNVVSGQDDWVDGSHSYSYDEVGFAGHHQGYAGCEGYGSYASAEGYGSGGWYEASSGVTVPETSGMVESVVSVGGKRRKDQVPPEIVEVKQDELMMNRPREDKSKLTGMAFGPSYQPVSTKGKPSKLHKRKHQIGALYFDMRQKETELAERRAQGLMTKAQTQAKYGW